MPESFNALIDGDRDMTKLSRLLLSATVVIAATAAVPGSATAAAGRAPGPGTYVSSSGGPGRFPLVAAGRAAPIVVSTSDHAGVVRVAGDLQADVERVTG